MEFGINLISVAKASPSAMQASKAKEGMVTKIFENAILKKKLPEPRVQFFDTEGKAHTLKEYRKNFIILYFFASWCADCLTEFEKLEQLAKELEYSEINDILIIPISIDFKASEQLSLYLKQRGVGNINFYLDPKKEMMGELGVHSLPRTFLINKYGDVIASFNRSIDWPQSIVIENLLKIKEASANLSASAQSEAVNIENNSKQKEQKKDDKE